mgnify:CR=1 FL=1
MKLRFIADENIPFRIIEELRKAGYDVLGVKDVAYAGIRNNELAEISIRLERVIITRDADFTRLTEPLVSMIKVIYMRITGDPSEIAQRVLENVKDCASIFQKHRVVMLDNEGCHVM